MKDDTTPVPGSLNPIDQAAPVLPVSSESAPSLIREPSDPAEIIKLLDEWLADDSGYDEAVWPELKESLERNRQGSRKLFRD
jgi:hypothetical protein